jgi:RNA polymerase sigma factor (sigma-70 family)
MESRTDTPAGEPTVWREFRKGDSAALAIIFNEYYNSLFYYGLKLVPDEDLVKDCMQNLFAKLWNNRNHLGEIRYVKPYLLKALRNHIGDEMVSRQKKKNLLEQFQQEYEISFSHEDFLIAAQVSEEQRAGLVQALNQLSKRQREAIFLKFYEDLEYEKIAEVMSLNVQSVRNLIYQSLKTLKEELGSLNLPVPVSGSWLL